MPGGKGNITGKDGKQFSKDYQPAEKWTEKRSLKIGNELIEWLKKNEANIFFEDFLYIENNYYHELIAYLSNKFTSFLKLIEIAKEIQKTKLVKYGVLDKLNATMTKFVLINNHGMKEKSETDVTTKGESIKNGMNIIVDSEKNKKIIDDMLNGI